MKFIVVFFSALAVGCVSKSTAPNPDQALPNSDLRPRSGWMCSGGADCLVVATVMALNELSARPDVPAPREGAIELLCEFVSEEGPSAPCGPVVIAMTDGTANAANPIVGRGSEIVIPHVRTDVEYRIIVKLRSCETGVVLDRVRAGQRRIIQLDRSCRP